MDRLQIENIFDMVMESYIEFTRLKYKQVVPYLGIKTIGEIIKDNVEYFEFNFSDEVLEKYKQTGNVEDIINLEKMIGLPILNDSLCSDYIKPLYGPFVLKRRRDPLDRYFRFPDGIINTSDLESMHYSGHLNNIDGITNIQDLLARVKIERITYFDSLEDCVFEYQSSIEIKNRLFNLILLKLLCSENNTSIEYGYLRTKLFTRLLGAIGVKSDIIDIIMNDNYSDDHKKELIKKI